MLKQIDFTKLPITEIVNEIIYLAATNGASDIHFDPTETSIRVRFRIDGVLVDYTMIPENIRKNLIARLKIISGMDITESRLPQDGAIKMTIKDLNLDMRVSSLPTNEGEKIVIRILDYSSALNGLESLGFTPRNLEKMKHLIKEPNGIILVTGATGSGKSTTVYSLLQLLNTPEVNLVTVEDPVEMNIKGINQIQVNSEIGLTFAEVLRSILRQDPDIIMIGEIRDDETAKIAVRASITGHLVLSTLHTNDALNTIERLRDMDVETYLLASSLNGIVSQKLPRKICPHCMKKRPAIDYEKKLIKANLGVDITELAYGEGCSECVHGYKGRTAIHEVLVINQEIRDAIANGMPKDELRKLVYTKDTTTLLQDGLQKVVQSITTIEEILRLVELDDESIKIINSSQSLIDNVNNNDNLNNLENTQVNNNTVNTSNTLDTMNHETQNKEVNIQKQETINSANEIKNVNENEVKTNDLSSNKINVEAKNITSTTPINQNTITQNNTNNNINNRPNTNTMNARPINNLNSNRNIRPNMINPNLNINNVGINPNGPLANLNRINQANTLNNTQKNVLNNNQITGSNNNGGNINNLNKLNNDAEMLDL